MSISWYSVAISLQNGGENIFNGVFSVNSDNKILNFFYMNNNIYEDILIQPTGNATYDYGADSLIVPRPDNVSYEFSQGGTLIKPVIGYINDNYNHPSLLQFYKIRNYDRINIAYKQSNLLINDWLTVPYNSSTQFISTFTPISYPFGKKTPIYRNSFFTNNSLVFYKPHNLSTGGGGSGVNNSRIKQRRT